MKPLTIQELTDALTKMACDPGKHKLEPQQSIPAKVADTGMVLSAAAELIKKQHKQLLIYREGTLDLIREHRRASKQLDAMPEAIDRIKASRSDNVVPFNGY